MCEYVLTGVCKGLNVLLQVKTVNQTQKLKTESVGILKSPSITMLIEVEQSDVSSSEISGMRDGLSLGAGTPEA